MSAAPALPPAPARPSPRPAGRRFRPGEALATVAVTAGGLAWLSAAFVLAALSRPGAVRRADGVQSAA